MATVITPYMNHMDEISKKLIVKDVMEQLYSLLRIVQFRRECELFLAVPYIYTAPVMLTLTIIRAAECATDIQVLWNDA